MHSWKFFNGKSLLIEKCHLNTAATADENDGGGSGRIRHILVRSCSVLIRGERERERERESIMWGDRKKRNQSKRENGRRDKEN